MEGEGEREREGDAANRLMEELEELITSPSEPAFDSVGTSFNNLQLNLDRTNVNTEQPVRSMFETNYREKLRSYSSFPSITLLDTSSQCTNTDTMDMIMYEHSLSDGDGDEGHRRRLRPQARQRRESQSKSKSQADPDFVDTMLCPSRRYYVCDVCGKKFPSPQSLGGHKNLHKNKGRKHSDSRRRSRAAPIGDHTGGQACSGSNSSESDQSTLAPSVYKGVRYREGDKWVTEIRPPKSSEKWWLGTFPSAEEAAQAYDVALVFFKSESELNFGHHPLYRKLPPLPPDLSPQKYAQRLRDMVKEISEQIIAERRSEEQAATSAAQRGPAVSPADSSSSAAPTPLQDGPAEPNFVTHPPSPATEFEWLKFLNFH